MSGEYSRWQTNPTRFINHFIYGSGPLEVRINGDLTDDFTEPDHTTVRFTREVAGYIQIKRISE